MYILFLNKIHSMRKFNEFQVTLRFNVLHKLISVLLYRLYYLTDYTVIFSNGPLEYYHYSLKMIVKSVKRSYGKLNITLWMQNTDSCCYN